MAALFAGDNYEPDRDDERLLRQIDKIRSFLQEARLSGVNEGYRTSYEICAATGAPQASVNAQISHLQAKEHGAYLIERRGRTDATREYRIGPKGAGRKKKHYCKRIAILEEALWALDHHHPLLWEDDDDD